MEDLKEIKKRPFSDEERRPYGRSIRPPLEICARNLDKPMYPLMLQLCYYCQKTSADRDAFETNSGKLFFNIQLCPRCVEFNRASQEAGKRVLQRYAAQEAEDEKAKTS